MLKLLIVLSTLSCVHGVLIEPKIRGPAEMTSLAVRIDVTCESGFGAGRVINYRVGSGVIVDGSHVLTANHVVECGVVPNIHVKLKNGLSYRMLVEHGDKGHDKARLYIASEAIFKASLDPPMIGNAAPHDAICAINSFPIAQTACGHVIDVIDGKIIIDFVVVPGNSGAPMYVDGRLVGILTHRFFEVMGGFGSVI